MTKITHISSYALTPAISHTVERINNVDVYRNDDGTIIGFIDSALNRKLGRVQYRARNAANVVVAWGESPAFVKRALFPAPRKVIGLFVDGKCVASFPAHLNAGRIVDLDDAMSVLNGPAREVVARKPSSLETMHYIAEQRAAMKPAPANFVVFTTYTVLKAVHPTVDAEYELRQVRPGVIYPVRYTGFLSVWIGEPCTTQADAERAALAHLRDMKPRVDLTKPALPVAADPVVIDTRSNAEIFAAVTVKPRVDLSKPPYVHPVVNMARDTRTFEEIMSDCIDTIRRVRTTLRVLP